MAIPPPYGWSLPDGYTFARLGQCPHCGAQIAHAYSPAGRYTPLDKDGGSHLLTCEAAPPPPEFDGATYVPERPGEPDSDRGRLTRQLEAIRAIMSDHQWHTLDELAEKAHCTPQSASARVRDLRKPKFGSHTVERRYVSAGLFEYRMVD